MTELVPGKRAFIVGLTGLMSMFDMSKHAARKLLREWWEEQQPKNGGPIRVFRKKNREGFAYFTTQAELHRWLPAARDTHLVREVSTLKRELEHQSRRVDKLVGEKAALEVRIKKLEAAHYRRFGITP